MLTCPFWEMVIKCSAAVMRSLYEMRSALYPFALRRPTEYGCRMGSR